MGRVQQRVGSNFETALDWRHSLYRGQRLAYVHRNGIKGRFVNKGVFVPDTEKSPPDYVAVIRDPHAVCFFDAKTTENKTRWTLPEKQRHQFHMMQDLAEFGAVCFFLIEARAIECFFLLRVNEDTQVNEKGLPFLVFKKAWTMDHRQVIWVRDYIPDDELNWLKFLKRAWLRANGQ